MVCPVETSHRNSYGSSESPQKVYLSIRKRRIHCKAYRVDDAVMTAEFPDGVSGGDIPKEQLAIAPHRCKAGVVAAHRHIPNIIAVACVKQK